jgi:hypothetical protein
MLQAERSCIRVSMKSLNFFDDTYSCQPHYGPGVDSSEYQKTFLGSKARSARKADKLTATCEPIDCLDK